MDNLPDFSDFSRSFENPLSERVSLHIDGPENPSVACGLLSCESQIANDGVILLDDLCDERFLREVDWLLSDEREYGVEFDSLSEDGRELRIKINFSQELE